MSGISNYILNQKINAILGKTSGIPSVIDLDTTLTAGNNAGSNDIDMNNNDILNVNNINGSPYPPSGPADNLTAVLTAGNTADNSIILTDGSLETMTLQKKQLTSANDDGTGILTNATLKNDFGGQQFLSFGSSVPFGYSNSVSLQLATGGAAVCGITHLDNFPSPNDFAISTDQNLILTANNIDLSSTGRLSVPSLASGDYLDYDTGKLTIVNDSVGGSTNPLLVLQNNTATAGSVYFETYKNDTPTSTGGDFIGSWSATCNATSGGVPVKTEIARINQIAYGVGGGNNDGGISFACKVNSNINTFLIFHGGVSAGEIQVFKKITAPNGAIELDATSSTGTGDINITSKNTADVNITSSAGGIILNTPSIQFQNTSTTTGGGANTITWEGTNTGGNKEFLYCKLNGNDIWLPYLTQDPT